MRDNTDYHEHQGGVLAVSDDLNQPTQALVLETRSGDLRPTVELLREVPEEDVWLQGQRSAQTRRAYKAREPA